MPTCEDKTTGSSTKLKIDCRLSFARTTESHVRWLQEKESDAYDNDNDNDKET